MYSLVLFLPLFSSVLCGGFGFLLGGQGCSLLASLFLCTTCLFSWSAFFNSLFFGKTNYIILFPWIYSGCLHTDWTLLLDSLSSTMLIVVTTVSFCVHVYSAEYMKTDPHICRFMSYLSLFTFFMISLVTADNLLQLFFGWEGVGLCSYLLISFWYTRIKSTKAALKAVLVNRVADVFIVLALGLCFLYFKTLNFEVIFSLSPWISTWKLDLICILLFLGAMGKSAQLGFHTWLPDAMEGPTPVSALIHAATMVTAGVFLVIRCSSLFEYSQIALLIITLVGACTAFVSATIALVQHDIKKIIAYSTCSQLGYMFFSCGMSGYNVGLFHLFNHAFFKALLFLGAGSLIHGMGDEQDARRLGGISNLMPFTYTCVLLGSLSLAGFPFLSGFYSKDFILETAIGSYSYDGIFSFWVGSITAFLTSFYSFRLIYLGFVQKPSGLITSTLQAHEPGALMIFPMGLLAIGSIFSGFFFKDLFIGLGSCAFSNTIFSQPITSYELSAEFCPFYIKVVPLLFSLTGIFLSTLGYSFGSYTLSGFWLHSSLLFLFGKRWFFDSFYNRSLVLPLLHFGYRFSFKTVDKGAIEFMGPTGLGLVSGIISNLVKNIQQGYIHIYLTLIISFMAIFLFI